MHTEHSDRSLGDNRRPHTTQLRGDMKSRIRVTQLVIPHSSFHIQYSSFLILHSVNTLSDDIKGKAAPDGEAQQFLVQLVLTLRLDALALLLQ